MGELDQSRFDDQHSGKDWLDAGAAAALLEVKRATLYAYVSRGLINARGQRRDRVYSRTDLERLAARRDARRGHRAVAGAALRWGEPVLESDVSEISEAALCYRGRDALELARESCFEDVAELLWSGHARRAERWTIASQHRRVRLPRAVASAPPLLAMRVLAPLLAAADEQRLGDGLAAEQARARSMIRSLARTLRPDADAKAEAKATTIAELCLGPRRRSRERAGRAIDAALILCADHGLNVSTFAARVAASAGADLYACFSAALSAFSGPLHGGACERIEALLSACTSTASARQMVVERGRLGLALPGFGHPLYPLGDVRAGPLIELARELGGGSGFARVERLLEAANSADREEPTIDLAVVALSAALRWPPGVATALFAIGRSAGWAAHIFEQRAAGYLLRPRAQTSGGQGRA